MLTIKKCNDIKVHPVPRIGEEDTRPVMGSAMFSELYSNIFCVARKKSGKTTAIYNIIKKCASKDTTIIAFVSTLYKDDNWKSIRKLCKDRNIPFVANLSLIDNGVNLLDELVEKLQLEAKQREDEKEDDDGEPVKPQSIILFNDSDEDEAPKKKKSKYRSPEYIIILDDLSTELRKPAVASLLKKNRHFFSKIIVSSQWHNDLLPESRKQIDYWLIFKDIPLHKLQELHRDADVHVPFEQFQKVYHYATKEPFNFLYVDCGKKEFRKNFSQIITVGSE